MTFSDIHIYKPKLISRPLFSQYVSFGLVFGSWPVALGTLPGGEHWIRLFFVMLFLLGIDSAFSFMEGFLTVLKDTKLFANVDRKILSFGTALCAFLFSLMYATDAGLIFLDTVDVSRL